MVWFAPWWVWLGLIDVCFGGSVCVVSLWVCVDLLFVIRLIWCLPGTWCFWVVLVCSALFAMPIYCVLLLLVGFVCIVWFCCLGLVFALFVFVEYFACFCFLY